MDSVYLTMVSATAVQEHLVDNAMNVSLDFGIIQIVSDVVVMDSRSCVTPKQDLALIAMKTPLAHTATNAQQAFMGTH